MFSIINYLRVRYMSQKAQGIVEYALLLALVIVVGAVLVNGDDTIASHVSNIFTKVKTLVTNADNSATLK